LVDVEINVSSFEDEEKKLTSAKMDFNEIISKVHNFVESIKETSLVTRHMAVGVDNFNFSIGKSEGKYKLKLNASFSFTPKELV
jgi:hypothetical protein